MDARKLASAATDAVCIAVFVLAGRQSHDIAAGAGWFFTVVWPFAVGWFGLALATRLYASGSTPWTRLAITWVVGVALALVLRAVVTHRDDPIAFVVVAFAFLGATTAGWRVVAHLAARRPLRTGRRQRSRGSSGR